jgi:hemolysin activation/secretion protein
MRGRCPAAVVSAAFVGCSAASAIAQVPPAATRDIGGPEEQFEVRPPAGLQLNAPAVSAAQPRAAGTVTIARFSFEGATAVSIEELETVAKPWTGRSLSPEELGEAVAALTAYLRSRGLYAAQAILPDQSFGDGEARIVIAEGRLGNVEIEQPPGARLRPASSRGFLSPLRPGMLIARGALDTPLLIANDLPGVRVEPVLTPGAEPGTADINVKVVDEPMVAGFVSIDNHEIRELGEVELTGHLRLRNPLGIGDLATVEAVRSHTGGRTKGAFSYSAPVGYSGTRLGASYSQQRYRIGGDFEPLHANGDARRYTVFATHPLLRMDDRNLSGYVLLNDVEYRDRIDAVGVSTDSRHRFLTARLAGDRSDALLGGGRSAFYVEYQAGNVTIDPAAADAALGTARHFSRGRLQLERNQRLTTRSSLYASWTAQIASKNLAAGREILLSGPNEVRAYPAAELIADEGYLTKLEYRHQLVADGGWRSAAALFVDSARGKINKTPLPGAPNTREIWGYGVSLTAAHSEGFQAELIFAWRGSGAPLTDPGRNPRVWFVATQYF